jgi:hypothetical protein
MDRIQDSGSGFRSLEFKDDRMSLSEDLSLGHNQRLKNKSD